MILEPFFKELLFKKRLEASPKKEKIRKKIKAKLKVLFLMKKNIKKNGIKMGLYEFKNNAFSL